MASVTLPATLFPPDAPADCKLQFVAFRTGSFFPLSGNSSNAGEHARRRTVNTPVIFVGLGEDTQFLWKRVTSPLFRGKMLHVLRVLAFFIHVIVEVSTFLQGFLPNFVNCRYRLLLSLREVALFIITGLRERQTSVTCLSDARWRTRMTVLILYRFRQTDAACRTTRSPSGCHFATCPLVLMLWQPSGA